MLRWRELNFNLPGMAFKECDLESDMDAFPGGDFLPAIKDFPSGKVPAPDGFSGKGDCLPPLLFVFAIDPSQQLLDMATSNVISTAFGGRKPCFWTSLYAEDAAIFVAQIKEDIDNLVWLLKNFGEISRLETNAQKSIVVPIRCEGINLPEVMQEFRRPLQASKCAI